MIRFLRKKLLTVIALVMLFGVAEAQQLPIYNQFNYNQFVYNPALSGVDTEIPVFTMMHRNQWTGVDGAPETSLISFNGIMSDKNVGYAAYLYNDISGILRTTSAYGNYSFSFDVVDDFRIALGLSAGIINKGLNVARANVDDRSDPALGDYTAGKTVFDFNAGINLSYMNFDFGFAVPQLFAQPIDYAQNLGDNSVVYKLDRHFVGSLKYTYDFEIASLGKLGKEASLVPQVITRVVSNVPVQVDAHLMLELRQLGWIGAGYRTDMGPMANLGVNLTDDLSAGYAYEFNVSNVSSQLGSTHELSLIYKLGGAKRLMDKVQIELEQLKKEEIELMNQMEERMIRRMDSIAEALRNDIVINANKLISHNETLESEGLDYLEEDDLSTTASNVVAGSKGFYIVAGVFAYRKNAEAINNKLASEGYDVEYFYNKANRYYYVFLRKYKTYEQASKLRKNNINGTYFDELWIKEVK
ncbi:MAG: PorP/SprF family type IX secretion system membrane protein [Bacteroidota bacterium]